MSELTLFDQLDVFLATDRFYNSTNLSGTDLKEHKFKAGRLNRRVLDFFKSHSYENYTAFEIWKAMGVNNAPITSIRRAVTDLTDMGYLVKTNIQRPGQYKELTYAWQIK